MHGYHENFHLGADPFGFMNHFNTAELGHGYIKDDQVRHNMLQHVKKLKSVTSFADDFEGFVFFDQFFQTLSDQDMIICHNNFTFCHFLLLIIVGRVNTRLTGTAPAVY